jgi:purine-nucleoside phosphorylase
VGYLADFHADIGIVLGSGLASFTDLLYIEESIPFSAVEGIPASTVPGHEGRFHFAHLGKTPVLVAQGRVHLYEGHSAKKVTSAVRFFDECGVTRIILTNAAGSLNPGFAPGTWMLVADHLNLTGASPFTGSPAFHDMGEVYSPKLRDLYRAAADARGVILHEGVYAGLAGPQYETPAEVRMLRTLGADAAGMSTVLEAMQAHALGMEVAAFSCLTNWASGIAAAKLDHREVLEVGRAAAGGFAELMAATL